MLLRQKSKSSSFVLCRFYTNVDRAQLEGKMKKGTTLIDVRGPEEIAETGVLEHGESKAKNVPLPELEVALALSKSDFKLRYKFEKPQLSDEVIFSCRAGRRSVRASLIAEKAGFRNVVNYTGGSNDWFS